MAGYLRVLIFVVSIYAQYVSGQATTGASAVVPTLTPIADVHPPLTVTGHFPW